jgi:hypothetical protein
VEKENIHRLEPVQKWFASAGHHEAPAGQQEHYLGVLHAFCVYVEKTPEELVSFCFLRKRATGERFISVKRRVVVNEMLEAFVAERGLTGKDAVTQANVIRGFLIHNGVLIQGKVWTGP